MPQVRANRTCFVDNGLRQEGDVFEYNGPPNKCLDTLGSAKAPEPKVQDDVAELPAPRPRLRKAKSAD
jgi:hypothetical protein